MEYFRHRREYIEKKKYSNYEKNRNIKSIIFKNVCIFVNGYTKPSQNELFGLIVNHGGKFSLTISPQVTHIVSTEHVGTKHRFSKSKIPIVYPEWITESIKSKKKLSYVRYSELPKSNILSFFSSGKNGESRFNESNNSKTSENLNCCKDSKLKIKDVENKIYYNYSFAVPKKKRLSRKDKKQTLSSNTEQNLKRFKTLENCKNSKNLSDSLPKTKIYFGKKSIICTDNDIKELEKINNNLDILNNFITQEKDYEIILKVIIDEANHGSLVVVKDFINFLARENELIIVKQLLHNLRNYKNVNEEWIENLMQEFNLSTE